MTKFIMHLQDSKLASYKAEITHPGQKDHYKFIVDEEGRYAVETEGRTDLVMALYGPDSETKLVARDDDSGTGLNAKISTDLSPKNSGNTILNYNKRGHNKSTEKQRGQGNGLDILIFPHTYT